MIFRFVLLIGLLSSCSSDKLPRANELAPSEGLVLVAPMGRTDQQEKGPQTIALVDKRGEVKRQWTIDYTPMVSKLDRSGNLMISGQKNLLPDDEKVAHGIYQHFEIIAPDGKVIWAYENKLKHHDFTRLPNGNIAFIQYYSLSPDAIKYRGQKATLFKGKVWPDKIIEVSPKTNEVVWEWRSHEHIDLGAFRRHDPRGDILHTNSIAYIENFYRTKKPAYMISARGPSKVYIIDKESKKVLWESPDRLFRLQHDAIFTGPSTVMAFSNGVVKSEVIEFDLKSKKVIWKYQGGDHVYDQMQFFSSIVSGAQRLSNGNTLITLGTRGYVLEVDANKNVVWNYFNQIKLQDMRHSWPFPSIFKARQYPSDVISRD